MKTVFRTVAVLVLALISLRARAQVSSDPAGWFVAHPGWSRAENVSLPEGAGSFRVDGVSRGAGALFYFSGVAGEGPHLRSPTYLGDCVLRMEYLLTPDAKAGLYLEGRYRLELAAADAAAKPGAWQTLEVMFRAPRFDDARNKTEEPLIIEVKLNGKIAQTNTVPPGRSPGSEFGWDDAGGHATIAVDRGSVALRAFSVLRADFSAVKVPPASGQASNLGKLVDLVKQGEQTFRSLGCIECHSIQADDASVKTGPSLVGLFTLEPRDRVVVIGGEGHRFTIKPDKAYLHRSLRTPADEVAIAEKGANQDQPYAAAMPPYAPAVVSDAQIDALGAFLATLNETKNQGPVVRLVEEAAPKNYDPMTDRLQVLVDRAVRIQRGPMDGLSGRSIHVGQPNGINYTFDPRVLAIAKIWQGGFLDTSGEYLNRGGRGFKPGFESREIGLGAAAVLLAPLNARGEPVDFSFKEAKFRDGAPMGESLNSPRDHLARVADMDAQFLGYRRASGGDPAAAPTFNYRIGRNTLAVRTDIAADGQVKIVVEGECAAPQSFTVNEAALGAVTVSAGAVSGGRWTLPAGKHRNVAARGKLAVIPNAWRPRGSAFDHRRQPLVVEPSKSTLPAGYTAETYLEPKDNYGREQLFEPLGLAVAPDGTLVVATRTAGIWRLSKGEWFFFADGLFDGLGIQVEDVRGLRVVAGQKAEVTRITDTDGDGMADNFETMTDAFSYHGNYHSYLHGPVKDPLGGYFITLNLDHVDGAAHAYRGGGKFMGTSGGYRGWLAHVPVDGGFEPWADGLRSPASLGFAPDGRLWYADNQGEFFGTSKLFVAKRGGFYGHPAGLVDRPGMTPASPEIAWGKVKDTREPAVLLFPQTRLANSPGNPVWDTTRGRFGAFEGQMFIGDQTQSNLIRVVTERVGAHEQGVAIPFATDLQSGVMRPVFHPNGSMFVGQTGRGWQAKGGRVASLQRITWDGTTVPPAIHRVSAIAGGFELHFTVELPAKANAADLAKALAISSWVYRDAPDYGSDELDDHAETVTRVEISEDRRSVRALLATTAQPKIDPDQTARVYRLTVASKDLWGVVAPGFDAFYTLYEFPTAP